METPTSSPSQARQSLVARWLGVATGSLLLAGLLSLLLVVSRTPGIDKYFEDPTFFRRVLAVHVDLSLIVWFVGFFAVLWSLMAPQPTRAQRLGPWVAWLGVAIMLLVGLTPDIDPILANYVPLLDHPLYWFGLALSVFALFFAFAGPGWRRTETDSPVAPDAQSGLRASAFIFGVMILVFILSFFSLPMGDDPFPYFEATLWGGGHLLQFFAVGAMLVSWLVLLKPVTGPPLKPGVTKVLFALFALPTLSALFYADPKIPGARLYFTRLMEFAIFPVVSIFILASVRAMWRHPHFWRQDRAPGLVVSILLTVIGFILGSQIRDSDTMIPAHYHANLSAVTSAFMTLTYPVLQYLGLMDAGPEHRRFWVRWQPVLFSVGMFFFALGYAFAAAARKAYGVEQANQLDTFEAKASLMFTGLGGIIAITGGVMYFVYLKRAWQRARAQRA